MSAKTTPVDPGQLLDELFRSEPERTTLDNGLTVVTRPDFSAELVSIQVWVKTGSIHEADDCGAGLSHFLEHMLFKGTARRGPLDISREVHALGGYINAYTSYDRTVYYIDAPSEQAEAVFDILADMSLHASLPADDFVSERDVILREIDMGADDPDRQLFYAFARTAFRQHPYRYPVIGLKPIFERITHEQLRAYYRARYQPANMALVVVGAIEPARVQALARQYFGQTSVAHVPQPIIPDEPVQLAPRWDRVRGDYNITRGMLGYKIPGLSSPEAPALDMLAYILGNGKSSLLWRVLREEKRLVQHIDASCWNPGSQGLLWISYTCEPQHRAAVEAEIQRLLAEDVAAEVTAETLSKAVRQAMVGEVNGRKTMSGQASRLGVAEMVVGELNYPQVYFSRLLALTPDDLLRVAVRYLVPSRLTALSLEPEEAAATMSGPVATARQLPDFEEVCLPNGARLLIQPEPNFPKVHLRLAMLGGPSYDPAEAPGAGGVLATLMTRDTARLSASNLAAEVDALGGNFTEFIGNNTFGLSAEVLPPDFSAAAGWMADALLRLDLQEEAFQLERDAQLASLLEDEDEILDFARRRLRRRFFGQHNFANDYLGTHAGLEALTLVQVQTLRQQLVTGPNVVLAVSGAVDFEQVKATLVPVLEALPSTPLPAVTPWGDIPAEAGDFLEHMAREQAVVLEAYPDVGVRDADFIVSEVLDELLSGMSSRLFEKVREEAGLAYYVGAARTPGLDRGMFTLYAGTHAKAVEQVQAEYAHEIRRLCSGELTELELRDCRTRLVVQKRQGQQAIGARAMQAALNALYGLPVNAWRDYPAKLEAITHEQVTAFCRWIFDPAKRVRLVTRPKG